MDLSPLISVNCKTSLHPFIETSKGAHSYFRHIDILFSEHGARVVVMPVREGKYGPVRVNLYHGDETRETGGPTPECFPL